ncbi:osteopontin [Psammomys obesus]|uniref:osteopontin n=1 Tax=Psammomys obesus TaxID=48139 RepID=UPI00245340AE|nr:osteopontin [Psammomys obesus]XP_055450510.1 osteopontin [Psammomys obesus]
MRVAVICFCLFGIAAALPVKVSVSGSSEEKLLYNKHEDAVATWVRPDPSEEQNLLAPQNVVSSEETDDFSQETLPSNFEKRHDHEDNDDDDDDDDGDHTENKDSLDSDESDSDSHHSDESEESVTATLQTDAFTPLVPTVDTPAARGDSLAYGLRARKLYLSDEQYSDATDEDLPSHVFSVPSDQDSNGKTSHESSQLDELSAETYRHGQSKEPKQDSHDSTEQSDEMYIKEKPSKASWEAQSPEFHSQEDKLALGTESKKDENSLKFRVSHELESSSSEVN